MLRFRSPSRRSVSLACATALALAGCRGDAVSVGPEVCTPETRCGPLSADVSLNALTALGDISTRITPTLAVPVRASLDRPVAALFAAIEARDAPAARFALVQTYDALAAASSQRTIDPAEVSAIRLALAPTSLALGVSPQAASHVSPAVLGTSPR